ncbi:MAG: CDP-diacylglycerol--serine O-phosphatidyltransferase [Gammaproteobacteria bacterium]|jgi:CDP-diacylglycerol---serine O-phosphatidyltransferase|nr:CDP-diacylglycerol--serine O-phosphatidyltransferase [Gammaproteobacteria bacterium]MBT4493342.1 CDP-diacylglycerol--serine O-phosphatidyltransferase [Gammaproteobacteria bacterium]MBT7371130.1 CDP-diacylglycerol--serine O-phosphatidyltransferase [Gammaproteobacteria bacterium]
MSEQESAIPEESTVTQLPERKGLKKGVFLLPNLVTTGALFSGFYAIIAAMTGSFENACIAIVIAGFLDALDGRIARLTNTTSEFGVQFDSMSDLVAFGVAPAVLLFSWALADLGKIGWIVAFLFVCCTALRLARFNSSPDSKIFFGLPSPMAAGTMATMVWTWVDNLGTMESIQISVLVAVFASVAALLMVSNVRYYSPKNIKGRVPFMYMLGAVMLFIVVAIYPPGMLFCVGLAYGASGPFLALLRFAQEKRETRQV